MKVSVLAPSEVQEDSVGAKQYCKSCNCNAAALVNSNYCKQTKKRWGVLCGCDLNCLILIMKRKTNLPVIRNKACLKWRESF